MGVPFALAVAALGSFTNSPRCSPNDNASRSAVMAWDASGSSLGDDQSSMGSLFSSSRLDELGYGSGHSKATDDSGDTFEFLSRTRRLQQQQRARAPSAFFAAETPSHLRSSLSLEALATSMASGRRSFSMSSLLTSSRQFGHSGLLQSSVSRFFLLSRQPNEVQDQPNDDDNRARRQDAEDSSMATEQLPPVSLHELFRFATTLETVVTVAGLLAAGVCGALVAISALMVGRAVAALSLVALDSSSDADGASSTIKRAALELVVLGFTCWILSSAATASTARSSRRQLVRIRIALLEQLVALGDATVLDWLEQQPGTDAAQTIARSVVIGDAHSQALQWLLTDGLARSCRLMAQFMGAAAVALMTSWKLGLVAGGAGLPLLAVAATMIESCERKEHEMAASSMSMQAHTVAAEALSSVRTLVAFNGQRAAQRAYTSLLSQAMREGCCDRKALALAHALGTGLSWTLLAVIVGYASSLSGSESTASDNEQLLQSALGLTMAVLSLQQLIPALFRVAAAQRSASPLFALLDTNPEVVLAQEERQADASYSPPRSVLPPSMRRQSVVELRDVHCLGLNGVSLAVASGERVAVVGKNCSVISSLLTRFGSPSRGQILLDGRDLQAINRRHLRAQLAVVPTVPVLFAGSIFDNIAMGIHSDSVLAPDPTASNGGHWPPLHVQQQVVAAAKLASVHELIMRLPDQYATRVDCKIDASFTSARFSSYDGEQNALTVGQMQLIVLARALIRYDSSRVLVIDRAAPHQTPQLQKADVDLVDGAICSLLQKSTGHEAAMLLLFSSRADANSSVLETNTGRSLVNRIVDIVGPSIELQEVESDVSTRPDQRMERGISADSDQSSLMSDTSGDEIISANDPERGGMSARSKRAATDASGVSAGEHELPWATLENCEYSFHSQDPATPVHVGNEDDGYADDEGSPSKERRQNAMKTAFEASGTTTRARQASVLSSYNSRHRMRAATLQSALPQTPHSLSSSSSSEDKWTSHTSLGKKMDALRSSSPSFGLWSALQFTRGEKRSLAVALVVSALLAFAKPTASAVIGMWVAEVLIHREGDSSTPIWWSVYCCTISAITFAIMQGALAYCSKRVTQSATIKLQTLHFRAMLAQPVRFFDEKAAEIEAITTSLAVHGPVVAGTLTGTAQYRLLEIVSLAFGSIVAVIVVTAVAAKSDNSFWWEFFVPAVLGVLPLASIGEALVSSVSALASSSDRQEDSLLSSSTLKSNDNEALKHVNETLAQLRTVLELGAEKPRCREFARLMEKGEVLTNKRFNSSIAAALVTSGGGLFLVRFTVVGILLFTGDNALEGSIGDADTSDARDLAGAVAVAILVIVTVSQALGDTIGWWQSRARRVYESGAVICSLRDSAKAHAAMERDMNTVIFASSRVNALSSTSSTFLSTSDTNLQAVSKNNRLPTRQRLRGSVAFRRLSFAYDDQRARNFILYNCSMNIRAGETVALCGVPESGKSTILALFERFYDPTPAPLAHSQTVDASGGIFFDGIDARALDARWLRDQMGLVALSQTAPLLLFKGSIADNISLGVSAEDIKGKPASYHCVSHEAIVEAAKAANAHTFISHLPDGYATRVDTLNASQALRVAIARAIVRNPALLLIDDVGAGQLDKMVATAIENVISRRKSSGKTTIMTVQMRLAHTQDTRRQQRSSSLTAALNDLDGVDVDRWFLINNGEITELNQQLEDHHEARDQEQQGLQQQRQSRHPMVQFASTPDAEQLIDRFWSDIDDDDDDDIEEAEPGSIHQSEHNTGRRAGIAHAMRLPDELLSLSLPPSPVPAVAESPMSSSVSPSSSLASSTASYQSLFSV